jgi:hypothetical protein
MDSYRVKLKHSSLHFIELKSMNNFYGYYVIRSALTWLHLNVATVNMYFNLCAKTVRWLEGFLYLSYCISNGFQVLHITTHGNVFSSIWLIGFRFLNFGYLCLFAHSGDQTYCVVFFVCFSSFCCQFLLTLYFWLPPSIFSNVYLWMCMHVWLCLSTETALQYFLIV